MPGLIDHVSERNRATIINTLESKSEHRVLDNVSPEIIDAIYKSKDGIPATEISNDPFKSNECFGKS